MRIAPVEQRDFVGSLRVLEHCAFPWRQRAGGIQRQIAVGAEHCPTCVELVERFGRWDHFVVPGAGTSGVERWHGAPEPSLHTLKELAAAAVDKRRHRKAAALFDLIALHEPKEAVWPMRAGQALHHLGEIGAAADRIFAAAAAYAWGGAYQKSHAACTLAVRLDPANGAARALLARVDEALLRLAARERIPSSLPPPDRGAADLQIHAAGAETTIAAGRLPAETQYWRR
jgi:hypothetical protein